MRSSIDYYHRALIVLMAFNKNHDKNLSSSATDATTIIDAGKTNKKLFPLINQYRIVYERSARFNETVDEDGFPCEHLDSLRLFVFDSLREVFSKKEFKVKAINFSAYGASLANIDGEGQPVCPLYNYLKPFSGS